MVKPVTALACTTRLVISVLRPYLILLLPIMLPLLISLEMVDALRKVGRENRYKGRKAEHLA